MVEFTVANEATAIIEALRERGVDVHQDARQSSVPARSWQDLDAEIERLSTSQKFRGLLAEVEGALARRDSLGLPELCR